MKKTVYSLMIIFLFSSCLTELDFNAGNEEAIVISGVITNSRDESTIIVSRSRGIQADVSKIKASGAIYKNGVLDQELVSINEGELVVPIWYMLEAGASYHVEITTEDGLEFQSTPQIVQPILRSDSISFELTRRQEGESRLGAPIYIWLVDVFAHIDIPPGSEGRYYKWHVDEAWSFESQFATCYLRREEAMTQFVMCK